MCTLSVRQATNSGTVFISYIIIDLKIQSTNPVIRAPNCHAHYKLLLSLLLHTEIRYLHGKYSNISMSLLLLPVCLCKEECDHLWEGREDGHSLVQELWKLCGLYVK